jgi:hypothetical protein
LPSLVPRSGAASLLGTGRTGQGNREFVPVVDLGTSQDVVALNLTELWRASVCRRPVSLGNPLSGQLRSKQLDADAPALSLDTKRAEALRQPFAGVDRRLPRQPQRIKQCEGLQQNLKVAQTNLSTFLTTRETFRLEQARNITPWKVIAPPKVLPRPVAPSVPRNLAIGAVLGLVAGAAAALLRNRLGPMLHHPNPVRGDLGQPLLGQIPYVPFSRACARARASRRRNWIGAARAITASSARRLSATCSPACASSPATSPCARSPSPAPCRRRARAW